MKKKKTNSYYIQEYTNIFRNITGIDDLSTQDACAVLIILLHCNTIRNPRAKSDLCPANFEKLRKFLEEDADNAFGENVTIFKEALNSYRNYELDRISKRNTKPCKIEKDTEDDQNFDIKYPSPEDDMETVSKILLQNDGVFGFSNN